MIRPHICLAGPIEGRSSEEAHRWREIAQGLLEPRLCAVSPMRGEMSVPHGAVFEPATRLHDPYFGAPSAIRHKNMLDVERADGMIVYLPDAWIKDRTPFGTILEIGWTRFRIPIVVITDCKHVGDHPVLADGVGWIVPTIEDACKVMHVLFDVYSEETHEHGLFLQRADYYRPITDTTAPRATGLYRPQQPDIVRVTFDGAEETDQHDPFPGLEPEGRSGGRVATGAPGAVPLDGVDLRSAGL